MSNGTGGASSFRAFAVSSTKASIPCTARCEATSPATCPPIPSATTNKPQIRAAAVVVFVGGALESCVRRHSPGNVHNVAHLGSRCSPPVARERSLPERIVHQGFYTQGRDTKRGGRVSTMTTTRRARLGHGPGGRDPRHPECLKIAGLHDPRSGSSASPRFAGGPAISAE